MDRTVTGPRGDFWACKSGAHAVQDTMIESAPGKSNSGKGQCQTLPAHPDKPLEASEVVSSSLAFFSLECIMPIDIQTETLCSIAEATKRFPGRPHISTIWRYVYHGIHGQRLDTIKVGGKRFTSHEAVDRFIERVSAAADGREIPVRSAKQRQRDIARAEAELAAFGI